MKKCSKCAKEKNKDEFHRNAAAPDGLALLCKECACVKTREWNAKNKKRKQAARRRWYLSDAKARIEYSKEWRAENREHSNAWSREYRKKNREKLKMQRLKRIQTDPERFRIKALVDVQRRLARKRQLCNNLTVAEWQYALEFFEHRCAYCNRFDDKTPESKICMEHWVPLSSPRCLGTFKYNVLPACRRCNLEKLASDPPWDWVRKRFGNESEVVLDRIRKYHFACDCFGLWKSGAEARQIMGL